MNEYSKKIRKRLKELTALAYERELETELKLLHEKFNDWENGKTNCFELNEHIHKFHNGTSKEIWKKYNYTDPDMIVSSAVAFEILKRDEVPEETLDIIDRRVKLIQEINEDK